MPIQSIVAPHFDSQQLKDMATFVQAEGYDVRPIVFPTVAKGSERIRICLHTYNTKKEVVGLVRAFRKAVKKVS